MKEDMTYRQTRELFSQSGYETVEMESGRGKVAICPDMGGRIVAASVDADDGYNPFFVNPVDVANGPGADKLIFRGGLGGRDWLGPEGCGDMSFYFRKGPLTFENWYVDNRHNLVKMAVDSATTQRVVTRGEIHMPNLRGNIFDIGVVQEMKLLPDCTDGLGVTLPSGAGYVAFERTTTFTNIGKQNWGKEYGYAMIWFLLMLRASDRMFIMAPYEQGQAEAVIDYRFDDTDIPPDRLIMRDEGSYAIFKGDGQSRGKIGQRPDRSAGILYGLDLDREFLTLLRFDIDRNGKYLDNRWTEQANTKGGDVMDAYNNMYDSEVLPGQFCEMETVSSRLGLAPNESASLRTKTGFFACSRNQMGAIVKETSGRDITCETF